MNFFISLFCLFCSISPNSQKTTLKHVFVCDLDSTYRYPYDRGGCNQVIISYQNPFEHYCQNVNEGYSSRPKKGVKRQYNDYGPVGNLKFVCVNCNLELLLKLYPNKSGYCEYGEAGGLKPHSWKTKPNQ